MVAIIFDFLTLEFDLFFENINLANNLWTVSAKLFVLNLFTMTFDFFLKTEIGHNFLIINIRAFILHKSISCDKIFLLVSRYWSLWPNTDLGHLWNWQWSGNLFFTTTSFLNVLFYVTYSFTLIITTYIANDWSHMLHFKEVMFTSFTFIENKLGTCGTTENTNGKAEVHHGPFRKNGVYEFLISLILI